MLQEQCRDYIIAKTENVFFLNWLVVTDVNGLIVYSRPGFMGHLNDRTCYK